jgi:alpha-methylacyl-CoA racemase
MSGPLKGIRIVEMVGIGPCPFAAMMLADMGAEVIRIDRKPVPGAETPYPMFGTRFDVMARGRRSLALDLKQPEGRELTLDLIAQADALIEGFRPGVMERLGLGPDVCMARNPKLVYGRITGWGQDGPLAKAAGHDLNYLAMSGLLHDIGRSDSPPPPPLNLIADGGGGGMMLAFGVLCGLLETRSSGKGQVIDAAMLEGSALLGAMIYGFKAFGAWTDARGSNMLGGGAHFYDTYACADDKFVSVATIEPQFYALLLDLCDIRDPAFDAQMDREKWPELKTKIAAIFKSKSRQAWCELLEGTDACFAPVLDMDEAPQHAHHRARGMFIELDGVMQPGPAPRFSRTVAEVGSGPARPGEHSEEVLRDWNVTSDTIEMLRRRNVI